MDTLQPAPVPRQNTSVTFARQVQVATIPTRSAPPSYAMTFKDSSSEEEDDDSGPDESEADGERPPRLATTTLHTIEPSAGPARVSTIDTEQKIRRLAANPTTASVKPTEIELMTYVTDVLDKGLIDHLKNNRRMPKSYRSLDNLRQMANRKCKETGAAKMRLSDWTAITRSAGTK